MLVDWQNAFEIENKAFFLGFGSSSHNNALGRASQINTDAQCLVLVVAAQWNRAAPRRSYFLRGCQDNCMCMFIPMAA